MTKLTKSDQITFESVFKAFEMMRQNQQENPDVDQMREQIEALAEITRSSDSIQKHLMATELQIMRSSNADSMASGLMLFLAIGIEIGTALAAEGGGPRLVQPTGIVN